MAYPPDPITPTDVDNDTPLEDVHPDLHDDTTVAVNDIVTELGAAPKGAAASVTARLTALDATVAGKEVSGAAASAVAVHAGAADPHAVYLTTAEGNAAYETSGAVATHSADTTAVHGIADTADLVLTDDARLAPGVDILTADPQTLVLDRVYTYNDLTVNGSVSLAAATPGVLTITADSDRALPAGDVDDVVGTMAGVGDDGIYVVTDLGEDGVRPWVLTRHGDYDTVGTAFGNRAFPVANGGTYFTQDHRVASESLDQWTFRLLPAYVEGGAAWAGGTLTHAGGFASHAEGDHAVAEGSNAHAEGFGTHAEASNSHAEGYRTHAEGDASHAEGAEARAEGGSSHVEGWGSHAHGFASHAEAGGYFASVGDAQSYRRVRFVETSDGAADFCQPWGGDEDADVLQANKTVVFSASLVASRVGGTEQKAWRFQGAMTNVGGTPALVGAVTAESWGAPTWTADVTANTDGPRVTVTGEAAKTVRWVATIEQTEVGI